MIRKCVRLVGLGLLTAVLLWSTRPAVATPPDNEIRTEFIDGGQSLGNLDIRDIAVGDIDQDGDLDAFFAVAGTEAYAVNDGSGTFTVLGLVAGGARPSAPASLDDKAVALADLDGDSDLDAYVVGPQNGRWYRNVNGSFSPTAVQTVPGADGTDVALGDLDNDGDVDLVTADGILRAFHNDGSGNFTAQTTYNTGLGPLETVMLYDDDHDGDLDATSVSTNVTGRIWRNNGDGYATASSAISIIGNEYGSAFADFDGDGDSDLVVVGPNRNFLFPDDGSHTYPAGGGISLSTSTTNRSVNTADVDNDGDIDIVTERRVWVNDGQASFLTLDTTDGYPVAAGTLRSSAVGDFDGDGDVDVMLGGDGGSANRVYFNQLINYKINYETASDQIGDLSGAALTVKTADFNGDGWMDIVWAKKTTTDKVWLNNGNFSFLPGGNLGGNVDVTDVSVGDVDNDGDIDIVQHIDSAPSELWLNDGSGNFTNSGQSINTANTTNSRGTLSDIDNDGDLDFLEINSSGTLFILANNGSGTFNSVYATLTPPSSGGGRRVLTGDVDNDGDVDVFAFFQDLTRAVFWRNDGNGTFTNTQFVSNTYIDESRSVGNAQLADVDNDGDLDLLMARLSPTSQARPSQLWWNQGNGFFVPSFISFLDGRSDVEAVDVDADGDLDLAWAPGTEISWGHVRVRENLGGGTFAPSGFAQTFGGRYIMDLAPADFNNDGRVEFASAVLESQTVGNRIYANISGSVLLRDEGSPSVEPMFVGEGNENGRSRFVFGHNGRTTDLPVRLSEIEFAFGTGIGCATAVTSDQVNATVARFHLRVDDGDAQLEDNGDDPIVATWEDVTLDANGRDVFTFDPNESAFTIAAGDPAGRFWITYETAAETTDTLNELCFTTLLDTDAQVVAGATEFGVSLTTVQAALNRRLVRHTLATTIDIDPAGNGNARLNFTNSYTQYPCDEDVFYSTDPYGGYSLLSSSASSPYTHAASNVNNPTVNDYYYVTVACSWDFTAVTSQYMGAFTFAITPGN